MEASVRKGCAERGSNSAPASGDEPGRSGVCSASAGGALVLGFRGDPFRRRGRRTERAALTRSGRTRTGRGGSRMCALGSERTLPRHGKAADPVGLLSIGRLLVQAGPRFPPRRAPPGGRGARPSYVPLSTIPPRRRPCQEPFRGRSQPLVADGTPASRWRRPPPRRTRPQATPPRSEQERVEPARQPDEPGHPAAPRSGSREAGSGRSACVVADGQPLVGQAEDHLAGAHEARRRTECACAPATVALRGLPGAVAVLDRVAELRPQDLSERLASSRCPTGRPAWARSRRR
jgi:hypothetical protein